MSKDLTFDEIRPYYDHEVNDALKRLTSDPSFLRILNFLYPEWDANTFNEKIKNIHSIYEFQQDIVYEALKRVAKKTTDGISFEGLHNIDKENSYIFLSNHRDIILDSAFLNYLFFGEGYKTTEVAIGDNLLINDTVTDLVKLNKNFVVHRNVPTRQLYSYSMRLSSYIHYTLEEKNTSIWIAQKEGRTKDGKDKTQPGVLKMFGIASTRDFLETYRNLKIVPVSISYEYEPCDSLKAEELYKKNNNLPYTKTKLEDRNSMVAGVTEPKGRIHFSIGRPILQELETINQTPNKNEQIKELALLIDQQIYRNYKLWPNNYIACDLMNHSTEFSSQYSEIEKQKFLYYLDDRISKVSGDHEQLRNLMLQMYGNPVRSKMNLSL